MRRGSLNALAARGADELRRGEARPPLGVGPAGEAAPKALLEVRQVRQHDLARALRVGNRPMLDGRSGDEIEELYRSRRPYYGQAHITIDTTGRSADQVVSLVLAALRDAHAVRA